MTPALTTHPTPQNAGSRLILALVTLLLLAVPIALAAGVSLQARPGADGTAMMTMEAANALYASGQYTVAAQAYQQLVEQGYGGRALLYNLGVAHLEAGSAAEAVASLRIAQQAFPRDAGIRTALADAERMARMAIAPDVQANPDAAAPEFVAAPTPAPTAAPTAAPGRLENVRLHWLSATEAATAALLLWTLLAALLLVAYAAPRGSGRRRFAALSAIVAGGALVFALLLLAV